MRNIIGFSLMVCGIIFGIYIGLWVMFIGGIVEIVNQFQLPVISLSAIAWSILRIILAQFVGWLSAIILFVPGYAMLKS